MKYICRIYAFYKRYVKNFMKYLVSGLLFVVLNVFLMWLVIDYIKIPTFIGASLVVGFLFILKFYVYIIIKLINKNFVKYTLINIFFSIITIILIWFFVDILNIPTVVSSVIVVFAIFVIKFFAFDITGLMKK